MRHRNRKRVFVRYHNGYVVVKELRNWLKHSRLYLILAKLAAAFALPAPFLTVHSTVHLKPPR